MDILGISCYYHDSAAALIRDGKVLAAAEEERFSRIKHDSGFPHHAIDFCLRAGGISGPELDYVVFYEKPFVKFERILLSALQTAPRSWRVFREAMVHWLLDKLWIKGKLRDHLGVSSEKILFCEHHLAHAASAFYPSPFQEAAILTVDGVGEWTTTAVGRGSDTQVTLERELRFPHSLGLLYSAFTAFLGFQVNEGEYKVMGMAPYGKPRYVDKVLKLIELKDDGSFWLDMDYFSYHYHLEKTFNRRFEELFGPPRPPETPFFTLDSGYPSYFGPRPEDFEAQARRNQHYADVAASIQAVLEEVLLRLARCLHEETGSKNLCIAGGVGLNSVANGRILRETPFERLFVQPAAGDGGGAMGAALWAYHALLGKPRAFRLEHAYWGQDFGEAEVRSFLEEKGIPYDYIEDDEVLLGRVVDALLEGQVVGWFQGRFEWGPRALGNRSILADPRRADMKDIVNTKIKFREPYRPFAPSVLAERTEELLELPQAAEQWPARFMLLVAPVREEKRGVIPAVTHVDGTGRLQTVFSHLSPRYHRLIEKFAEATGVPAVLNTSFNLRGEPIVTTPENAYNTFARSGMDLLIMNHHLIEAKGKKL
jgi:carbamoyltransferase